MKPFAGMCLVVLLPALAYADENTLCTASERVFFSCEIKQGRQVSVCGSADLTPTSGYLQYRIGKSAAVPELVFPADFKHPAGQFDFSNEGFGAKSSTRNLRFRSGAYVYVIYASTYAFGTNAAGVAVKKGVEPIRYVACQKNIAEKDFYLLQNLGIPVIGRDDIVFER
ncbi:MAG: hypothetical protein V4772_09060 [Pseudomonadota bacterium]